MAGPTAVMERPVFEPGSLTDLAGAPDLFDRYPLYERALGWLRAFVAQPHPELGRAGHVCPRLAPALDRNLVWFVALRTEGSSTWEAAEKGRHLADLFEALFATPERFRAGALLGFFPALDAAAAGEFIDGGHRLARMSFVERGLMIGEFHPASTVASVHNPDLLVMRCPVPMFAVRALSRHDLLFLDRPGPAAEIGAYLRHYLRYIGDQLTIDERSRLLARIQALSPEVGGRPGTGWPAATDASESER